MIEIRSITKKFGGLTALDSVSFTLPAGKIYGLIGPNGSGKTTLVNILTGFLTPDGGEILFNGKKISGLKPHIIARMGIVRTFQSPRIFPNLTVEQNILVASPRIAEDKDKLEDLLKRTNLISMRRALAGTLNFGQRKLLEIARALSLDPQFLILDEPLSGLDMDSIKIIIDYCNYINSEIGKTLLIIEHNLDMLFSLVDHVIVLSAGRKVVEGHPESVRNNPVLQEVYFGGLKAK
jgi:ABC-type branched-subunit amino acid transport system ATPase component